MLSFGKKEISQLQGEQEGLLRTSGALGAGGRPPGAKLFWSLGASAAGELFINRTSPAPRLQRRNKGDQNFPGATRPLPGVETGAGADGSAPEWRPRSHSSAPPPTQTFSHQDRWGMTGHPGPQGLHL